MILRSFIGILILGFCATMTALLVRMVYFPEESRLAMEDPQLVMERFLSRVGTESSLDIWKGNEIVGYLRLEPHVMSPSEQRRMGAVASLWADGSIQVPLPIPGATNNRLTIFSKMAMDLNAEVKESELTLRLDSLGLNLAINQDFGQTEPHVVLRQQEAILIDSAQAAEATGSSRSLMGLLLGTIGADPADLEKREKMVRQEMEKSVTTARRGGFEVMGQEFKGYVLTTTLGGDRKFTLYISEAGEVIQMKTFLEYRFISDGLRPDGVNGPETSEMRKKKLPGPPTIPLPK